MIGSDWRDWSAGAIILLVGVCLLAAYEMALWGLIDLILSYQAVVVAAEAEADETDPCNE
jgi:hypothetical protein